MAAETPAGSMSGSKVCALGDFTSKLAAAYLDHIAGKLERDSAGQPNNSVNEQLRKALDAANLPVTTNIIVNLLKSLEEHHQEKGGANTLPISWGEFCACCIALHSYQSSSPQTRAVLAPAKRPVLRACSSSTGRHEVFLGGSCNPTTWRVDAAVPTLHNAGITCFNPQVDEWFPELIEVEEQAKMAATLLLFVVDSQTRAISSMVEIAFLAGQSRDVVSVVEDISAGATIAGEALSDREIQDLNRGRLFIRNLVEEGGCLLSDSIESALSASVQMIKEKLLVGHYCSSRHQLKQVPSSLGEELHLLHRVFTMYDNEKKNRLTLSEAELALRSLHIEGPHLQQLLASEQQGSTAAMRDLVQQHKLRGLSFDEFCCVYAELKYVLLNSGNSGSLVESYISTPLRWLASWFWAPVTTPTHHAPFVDVFLNGSCGSTTWRSDISVPILKQQGVSYFNPQVSNWDRRLLPIEREAKERCSVLLYVITGETLAVASMVEAAYYIGRGRSVVLCVLDLPSLGEVTVIEGMELNQQAVKDYNRGRAYLTSMANKSRVAVYDSVAAATMSAVHLALCVRGQKAQYRHSDILRTSHSSSV